MKTRPFPRLTNNPQQHNPIKSLPAIIVALTLILIDASASEGSSTSGTRAGTALLTLDGIFGSDEFDERGLGQFRWSKRTPSYFTLDTPQTGGRGRDLVRNDLATGRKEVVVPASAFIPPGYNAPLDIQGFEYSTDESKLLIFTHIASACGGATRAGITGCWTWPRAPSGSWEERPHPQVSCSPSSRLMARAWPTFVRTTSTFRTCGR